MIRDARRERRDRAAELAHPGRGAAGLPLGLDHRQRPAAGLRARSTTSSASSSVTHVRVGVADPAAAAGVLERARCRVTRDGDRLVVEGARAATPARTITRVLADAGHLRPRADPGARRPRVGVPAADPATTRCPLGPRSRPARRGGPHEAAPRRAAPGSGLAPAVVLLLLAAAPAHRAGRRRHALEHPTGHRRTSWPRPGRRSQRAGRPARSSSGTCRTARSDPESYFGPGADAARLRRRP